MHFGVTAVLRFILRSRYYEPMFADVTYMWYLQTRTQCICTIRRVPAVVHGETPTRTDHPPWASSVLWGFAPARWCGSTTFFFSSVFSLSPLSLTIADTAIGSLNGSSDLLFQGVSGQNGPARNRDCHSRGQKIIKLAYKLIIIPYVRLKKYWGMMDQWVIKIDMLGC